MLFNSYAFLFLFLPVVLGVAVRLKGSPLLRWVTLSSFVFYGFAGHAWFLIPMLITTVLDFYLAPRIAAAPTPGRRRAVLILSLTCNLGLLGYFKYSSLLLHTSVAAARLLLPAGSPVGDALWLKLFHATLPAGISFYTFQTMSYVIDVYRGHAEPEHDFWKFAGFVSFFPHLVAGPLTRHNQLIPGLTRIAEEGVRPRWREGVFLFSIGLIKKVLIADRIANLIDPTLDAHAAMSLIPAWMALLGYTLQIYFDFSGYSDMAIGIGRLFSIELPLNFNSPYTAVDPSDFWRRWHMTLSSWLKDYLYIGLGGNRCSEPRRDFNLMMTMFLGGLWHGANWTFAAWGVYHGGLLIVYRRIGSRWSRWPVALQRGVTFLAVAVGWVFFRAQSFRYAATWLRSLAGLAGAGAVHPAWGVKLPILLLTGLAVTQFFPNAAGSRRLGELNARWQVALAGATVVALLYMNVSSRFLYFQF